MDSDWLPKATSPKAMDDAKAVSRRTFTGHGETQEAIRMVLEGETSATGHLGEQIPWRLALGATSSAAPSRIPFRKPVRLRIQASSLLRKKEVRLFRR